MIPPVVEHNFDKAYQDCLYRIDHSLSKSDQCKDESLIFGFDNGDSRSFCGESDANTPWPEDRYASPKKGTGFIDLIYVMN